MAQIPGAVACVQAENIEIILSLIKRYKGEGKDGLAVWSKCRPNLTESESVRRAIDFADAAGCPLYFAHISTREALEVVRKSRAKNKRVFAETCPHYLTFTYNDPLGILGKVNPPFRSAEDIAALWEGISDGSIDTIGSDHCPFRREDKRGDIWDAATGFPGSATLLPVLLSEGVHKNRLSLERVAEITAYNSARIFNLFPRKGTIHIGSDADFCVVDMDLTKRVEPKMLHSYSDFSLYEDWNLKGWPVLTIVRGRIVMKDGRIIGPGGHGRFIESIGT